MHSLSFLARCLMIAPDWGISMSPSLRHGTWPNAWKIIEYFRNTKTSYASKSIPSHSLSAYLKLNWKCNVKNELLSTKSIFTLWEITAWPVNIRMNFLNQKCYRRKLLTNCFFTSANHFSSFWKVMLSNWTPLSMSIMRIGSARPEGRDQRSILRHTGSISRGQRSICHSLVSSLERPRSTLRLFTREIISAVLNYSLTLCELPHECTPSLLSDLRKKLRDAQVTFHSSFLRENKQARVSKFSRLVGLVNSG